MQPERWRYRAGLLDNPRNLPETSMYALIAIGLAVGAMALLNFIEFKRID
jgi:hypothetical protein